MCTRGVWQLEKVIIQYSETGHSSRGVRFYFRHLLYKWKEKNQQVVVSTIHEQYEEPVAIFYYANNTNYTVSLKDLKPRQIEEVLNLHRNSESGNEHLRHGGAKVFTLRRSIQGLWRPSFPSQLLALKWFYKKKPPLKLPKYSPTSLNLSLQAIRGDGRWGSERVFQKGWDQLHLKNLFLFPFRK